MYGINHKYVLFLNIQFQIYSTPCSLSSALLRTLSNRFWSMAIQDMPIQPQDQLWGQAVKGVQWDWGQAMWILPQHWHIMPLWTLFYAIGHRHQYWFMCGIDLLVPVNVNYWYIQRHLKQLCFMQLWATFVEGPCMSVMIKCILKLYILDNGMMG